ncbi:hypothetical protein [Leisingera sp. McT4-56]|uniref:hypothetical protein n=1 Tax=Leisingera sp. McT4-56 TaxID=2881255 RepID=UPI001CF835B8|nr:hypothetical protein [Leisingera sp. McT4-56]MCB4458032.1 hypothetical protein [Leisingera sp. McT4-56]
MAGSGEISGTKLRADWLSNAIANYAHELMTGESAAAVPPPLLSTAFRDTVKALSREPLGALSLAQILLRNTPELGLTMGRMMRMAADDFDCEGRSRKTTSESVVAPFQLASAGGTITLAVGAVNAMNDHPVSSQGSGGEPVSVWSAHFNIDMATVFVAAALFLFWVVVKLTRFRRRLAKDESTLQDDTAKIRSLIDCVNSTMKRPTTLSDGEPLE